MKKAITLLILLHVFVGAFAQRNVDLKFNALTSPAAIHNGIPFTVIAHIRNLGPDAVKPNDSIQLGYEIANQLIPSQWVTGVSIPAHDSLNVTDTLVFSYSVVADSNVIFCAVALLQRNVTADSAIDPVGSDQETCNFVILSAHGGVNVPAVAAQEIIKVYPNPAHEQLIIEHAAIGTQVRLYNLVGQQVFSKIINCNKQDVDIHDLQKGTYILQLIKGDGSKTSKTVVKE